MTEDRAPPPEDNEEKPGGLARRLRVFGRRDAGAGITFGVVIVVFALGGHWLDGRLGSSPAFLLIGLAVGAVGGFIHLVEVVSPGTLFRKRKKHQN